MEATNTLETTPLPGLAEAEATHVWTEQRLRALRRAAFVGDGYDPDVYDTALLTHRAARACVAAGVRHFATRPSAP